MVTKTLDGMAAGGMYDLVGGGFHRYSVDERWLVPHFEKMLYDNALLASTYLHAFVVTGEPRYRAIVEETLDYVIRELRLPDGGLASAQDADTNGVEGLTFTWTEEEGVPAELLQPFEHGRSIIRGSLDPELRARLLAERELRPQPGLDDKVLASWNGLALAALAEGARRLERADWLDAARGVGEFLLGPLSREDGRLSRSWREGKVSGEGFLDDYANVAHGLLELHLATGEPRFLTEAHRLALLAVELFHDPAHGGFFLAPTGGEELVARTKGLDDNPIPSGNSMLAHVLLRLGRIWGDDELERLGVSVLRLVAPTLDRARRVPSAGRSARSTSGSRRRARSRSSGLPTAPSRGRRSLPSRRTRSPRSGLPTACRCSRERPSSTASRRSTSASGLPVRRPSPTPRSSRAD